MANGEQSRSNRMQQVTDWKMWSPQKEWCAHTSHPHFPPGLTTPALGYLS